MSKNFDYSTDLPLTLENEFKKAEFLGEGHNGVVFLLPNNRIIKFFRNYKAWEDESYILMNVKESRFFPTIYEHEPGYIVRDYVGGVRLDKYLEDHELSDKICEELYDMINEFEILQFKRLDIRCKDLFVQDDESIMIIDPKNNYRKRVSYPRHLMKGLHKRKKLERFLDYLENKHFRSYVFWQYKMNRYLRYNRK